MISTDWNMLSKHSNMLSHPHTSHLASAVEHGCESGSSDVCRLKLEWRAETWRGARFLCESKKKWQKKGKKWQLKIIVYLVQWGVTKLTIDLTISGMITPWQWVSVHACSEVTYKQEGDKLKEKIPNGPVMLWDHFATSIHRTQGLTEWFEEININHMLWPSHSPDLNSNKTPTRDFGATLALPWWLLEPMPRHTEAVLVAKFLNKTYISFSFNMSSFCMSE